MGLIWVFVGPRFDLSSSKVDLDRWLLLGRLAEAFMMEVLGLLWGFGTQ